MNNNKKTGIEKSAALKWKERAKWRMDNSKWLDYSNSIALRILSAMEDMPGMSQRKLSALAGVSPQHVHKIVKGHGNLTLQTIAKFSDILGIELISFPPFKYNYVPTYHLVMQANGQVFELSINLIEVNLTPIGFDQNSIYTGQENFISTSLLPVQPQFT